MFDEVQISIAIFISEVFTKLFDHENQFIYVFLTSYFSPELW